MGTLKMRDLESDPLRDVKKRPNLYLRTQFISTAGITYGYQNKGPAYCIHCDSWHIRD